MLLEQDCQLLWQIENEVRGNSVLDKRAGEVAVEKVGCSYPAPKQHHGERRVVLRGPGNVRVPSPRHPNHNQSSTRTRYQAKDLLSILLHNSGPKARHSPQRSWEIPAAGESGRKRRALLSDCQSEIGGLGCAGTGGGCARNRGTGHDGHDMRAHRGLVENTAASDGAAD